MAARSEKGDGPPVAAVSPVAQIEHQRIRTGGRRPVKAVVAVRRYHQQGAQGGHRALETCGNHGERSFNQLRPRWMASESQVTMLVREFLEWIDHAPSGQRADAAHALARAYLDAAVDADIRSAMEAAMTVLLDDPAHEVRAALADALGSSPAAPRHVIISLAVDTAEVAAVVLARSPLLIDAELIDIAGAGVLTLQQAIASRPVVAGGVSAALGRSGRARRLPHSCRQRRRCHCPHQLPPDRRALRRRCRIARRHAGAPGSAGRRASDAHPQAWRRSRHDDGDEIVGRRGAGADGHPRGVRPRHGRAGGRDPIGRVAGTGRASAHHRSTHHGVAPARRVRRQCRAFRNRARSAGARPRRPGCQPCARRAHQRVCARSIPRPDCRRRRSRPSRPRSIRGV